MAAQYGVNGISRYFKGAVVNETYLSLDCVHYTESSLMFFTHCCSKEQTSFCLKLSDVDEIMRHWLLEQETLHRLLSKIRRINRIF